MKKTNHYNKQTILKALFVFLTCCIVQTLSAQCSISGGVILDDGTTVGQVDEADHLQKQVRVNLFRDRDCNGIVNAGDVLLDVETTGKTGLFTFANLFEGGPAQTVLDSTAVLNENDAEENIATGTVDKLSNSLDIGNEQGSTNQIVALRFLDTGIPFGATINSAHIQFNARQNGTGSTIQRISAEATTEAASIISGVGAASLSQRLNDNPSIAFTDWVLEASQWVGGEFVQTPDLSEIVQELVNMPGWKTTSPLMLFLTDPNGANGTFRARSAGSANNANHPKLIVSWSLPEETGFNCYVIEPNLEDLPENAVFVNGSSAIPVDLTNASFDGNDCSTGNFIAYNGNTTACYAVAERPNELRIFNRYSGKWATIGMHGMQDNPQPSSLVEEVEAIAMDDSGIIYTVNLHSDGNAYLGTLDPYTGEFTTIGPALGMGENAAGELFNFTDVDALTYNPLTGFFWGMQGPAIVKIDPQTAQIIPNAFEAPGKDFIFVQGLPQSAIDDIAIDPTTGMLYAISDNGGGAGDYYLVIIDTQTAQASVVGQFQTPEGMFVQDFEGLAFAEDGQLYAVTGEQAQVFPDRAFKVDKTNANVEPIARFTPNNSDMEGCACRNGQAVVETNPEDIGTSFTGSGNDMVENFCEDFEAEAAVICSSTSNTFDVLLSFQGGTPGNNGYTIINNLTASVFEFVPAPNFVFVGLENGMGYSYTIFVADHPECQITLENSMIDCISTEVSWLNFEGKAQRGENVLDWQTASEKELDYFVVERSVNGRMFESIGTVKAAGNSNTIQTYQFVDKQPARQTYYRLKEVDWYQNVSHSKVIKVTNDEFQDLQLMVVPNVVEQNFNLFSQTNFANIHLYLLDAQGRLLEERTLNTELNGMEWDMTNYPSGIYVLKAATEQTTTSFKLIKR